MPKGGKTLLLQVLGTPPDAQQLAEIAGARHSETEWRDAMAPRTKTLSDREQREIAAYLVVNMPLAAGALAEATGRGDPAFALPADGRELAWSECQYCHSLFTGYLMHARDVQGWRNIFLSPFHRGMKMTAQQRETFANYSAINMPMKIDEVPADLRF
jgi:hypothetical protein